MAQSPDLPTEESSPGASYGPKTWSVGTLTYDKQALFVLFFWLMWNDFSITLIEQIGGLNGFLMIDHGATLTQMALLGLPGIVLPWLNPWVSTWSDRHRGPMGRRRPFLFFATPFYAFFLGCFPYMPTIYHHIEHNPLVVFLVRHLPDQISGPVFFMGACGLLASIFNAVVLAIFSYLYWDVVPPILLGRFQAMSKLATMGASLIWLYFIYGMGEIHSKSVYLGTAFFSLIVYLVSVWQIKEPEYPPPDSHKAMESLDPISVRFEGVLPTISYVSAALAGLYGMFFIYAQGFVFLKMAVFFFALYGFIRWQTKTAKTGASVMQGEPGILAPTKTYTLVISWLPLLEIWAKLAPVRAYFVECFSKAYFMWIFVAMLFNQMGNQGGGAQGLYLRYDLNIPLYVSGPATATATLICFGFGLLLGFKIGSLTDQLNPVRLAGPIFVMVSLVAFIMYFMVHDIWSFAVFTTVRGMLNFCQGVIFGAYQIMVFPREKIGQFCSAQAVFYQMVIGFLSVPIAMFWDLMHRHYVNGWHVGFVWSGMFYFLAALCYFKVYLNWKNRHGQVPVPHAG
jgi:hypothetical protein